MPELPDRHTPSASSIDRASQSSQNYRIVRKGSRYNIIGPNGRIYRKYKSASAAGPRWEELTHTPWPHKSSAYESGLRLWELGIITRDDIGRTKLRPKRAVASRKTVSKAPEVVQEKPTVNAQRKPAPRTSQKPDVKTQSVPVKQATTPQPVVRSRSSASSELSKPVSQATPTTGKSHIAIPLHRQPPALPAPKINLARQQYLIAALRKDPRLLFTADVQTALRQEVEYHRPYAKWAKNLLKLLARYEARQRSKASSTPAQQNAIMARHIAWQEQRLREVIAAT